MNVISSEQLARERKPRSSTLLAWLGTSTIRSFLFQVEAFDPMTLGSVAGLILVLSLTVSLRAALRVARVDLAQVLRNE